MSTQVSTAKPQVHGLEELRTIGDWSEWKVLWANCQHAELQHSLLHFGMKVNARQAEDWIQRLCFYMDVADNPSIRERTENDQERWHWHKRQTTFGDNTDMDDIAKAVSQKAFAMLCTNFFKNTNKNPDPPSWIIVFESPVLLDKILWFFRRLDYRIANYFPFDRSSDPNMRIVHDFVFDLCRCAWKLSRGDLAHLKHRLPDFLTLLYGIGELSCLTSKDTAFPLGTACRHRLRELIMGTEYWLPNDEGRGVYRLPRSINEACLAGSKTANVLVALNAARLAKLRLRKAMILRNRANKLAEQLERIRSQSAQLKDA